MKCSLWRKVLHDTFTDRNRKKISSQEVSIYCNHLAQKVLLSYKPDYVIAIDFGGSIPGELVAQILCIPVIHIGIRRDINISRMYNQDPILIRWIMSAYHHFLFHTTKPIIFKGIDIDISEKKILIIDDSFHTGATIEVAIKYLNNAFVSEIKTASLAYVLKVKPDFSVLPAGNYCFPWSKDFTNNS